MNRYIDAEKLKTEIERFSATEYGDNTFGDDVANGALDYVLEEIIPSLQQEQPEPYFYCKYGGIMPLCSDCKRNHSNSSFKTEEITTWYAPSCGTKQCIDYIQQEQPEADLEKTVEFECIGKKVKMTVQELINYYIDRECCDVAEECGF